MVECLHDAKLHIQSLERHFFLTKKKDPMTEASQPASQVPLDQRSNSYKVKCLSVQITYLSNMQIHHG